jgi:predicted ATPase
MKIIAFRIRNFRSIVDSAWINFSFDGVTALVGQNESGKSSILNALHFALSNINPDEDDFRIQTELPTVDIRVKLEFSTIKDHLINVAPNKLLIAEEYLLSMGGIAEVRVGWELSSDTSPSSYRKKIGLTSEDLDKRLSSTASLGNAVLAIADAIQNNNAGLEGQVKIGGLKVRSRINSKTFARAIWKELPLSVLFREDECSLPNHIDLDDDGTPVGPGAEAAAQFLKIADVNLKDLLNEGRRSMEGLVRRANEKVTVDFQKFWTQTVGMDRRLSIRFEIDHYNNSEPEKAGQPYLVFWMLDGNTQLYPKQRSHGVRWFVSFYLQLKASEVDGLDRIFLLDEPGANLHSRAQVDVLRLINQLSLTNSSVVYTTHSPDLIEYSKLYRVHAVQRLDDTEYSPTTIIDAHKLGTASTDTLSPILNAMGADLSRQQVIQKENNVLLEEMSGFYYLTAFWKLTEEKKSAYFIAATGVNKIEALANMFRGWGLDFIVAMDDDKQGREAYKSIKKQLFGDDDILAKKSLIRLPDCPAIEDAFSVADFSKFVLEDENAVIPNSIGEFLKTAKRSKPVLAFKFAEQVANGTIVMKSLDNTSQLAIYSIVAEIAGRLKE